MSSESSPAPAVYHHRYIYLKNYRNPTGPHHPSAHRRCLFWRFLIGPVPSHSHRRRRDTTYWSTTINGDGRVAFFLSIFFSCFETVPIQHFPVIFDAWVSAGRIPYIGIGAIYQCRFRLKIYFSSSRKKTLLKLIDFLTHDA